MAKLSIFFIIALAFCLQCSMAARLGRDVSEAPSAPSTDDKTVEKAVGDVVDEIQNFFKNNFSQDQIEKFGKELQSFGEQAAAKGKEILNQASSSFQKLQESKDIPSN